MTMMTKPFSHLLFFVGALIHYSNGYENLAIDETSPFSNFQVLNVEYLKKPGRGYDHRDTYFGEPKYGTSVKEKLYYAMNSQFCDETDIESVDSAWAVKPYILMVDRGGCSYIQKVRNAQKLGAVGVVIADNRCKCSHGDDCTPDHPDDVCEARDHYLAASNDKNNNELDVKIPAFLLYKQDADPIKEEAIKRRHWQHEDHSKHIIAEMSWSRLNPRHGDDVRVDYEIWTKVDDHNTFQFLKEFEAAAMAFGNRVYFSPHFAILDGISMGCFTNGKNIKIIGSEDDDAFPEEDTCDDMCTNKGRYCVPSLVTNEGGGVAQKKILGRDIVRESLRRECIWHLHGRQLSGKSGREWWDYITIFNNNCNNADNFVNQECIADAMQRARIQPEEISDCENKAGGYDTEHENWFLLSQMNAMKSATSFGRSFPMVFVNKVKIHGSIDFVTIFTAICAGFEKDSQPKICSQCASCFTDQYKCVVYNGQCPSSTSSSPLSSPTSLPKALPTSLPKSLPTSSPKSLPSAMPISSSLSSVTKTKIQVATKNEVQGKKKDGSSHGVLFFVIVALGMISAMLIGIVFKNNMQRRMERIIYTNNGLNTHNSFEYNLIPKNDDESSRMMDNQHQQQYCKVPNSIEMTFV